MSAAPKMCKNPCETCTKEGLPLLLVRYAVMPSQAGAPKLRGTLDAPELNRVDLGKGAHYGLRLLRSGYVYVFDEARKHWDEYFATADGFLTKLPVRILAFKAKPLQPATEFACARNGVAPLAGLITIRNPKHATRIWIAFSNVEWTNALFLKHQDAAFRQRHMRCISIAGGKVAPQAGAAPIEQIGQWLPEFSMKSAAAEASFSEWCPHRYNDRQQGAGALLDAIKEARPEGGSAVVALHDPTGLAMEIAGLMDLHKSKFFRDENVAKPRYAASTIASLEHTIKELARSEALDGADEAAAYMVAQGGAANLLPSYQKMVEKSAEVTPAQLLRAEEDKWRSYTHSRTGQPRFDYAASQAWLKRHNDSLLKLDAEHIAPLAKAHVAWMKHRCMVSYMSCNFDTADLESGVAFVATITDLMRGVTDKQPSYELYLEWLKAGDFAEENLVMRALGFNQTELIERIKKADAAAVDCKAFPTDAVAGAVGAFMEKLPPAANAQLTALLAGLSGPALKYWDDFSAGKVSGKAAAALAAVSGKQFVRLPVVGNRGQFIQAYMHQLYRLDPSLRTRPNELQSAIARQLRLLKIQGVEMQGSRTQGWYVLLDKEVVAEAVGKNLSGQDLADELAKALRTPEDLRKLDMRRAMSLTGRLTGAATVISGALMLLNFSKLLNDVSQGMSHELEEARTKLMLGKIVLVGFVGEQTGNLLEKLGESRLRNMMGRIGAYTPRALQWTGRFAGFAVGVILGLWDISKGEEASEQGDRGLAFAYRLSGATAIAVGAAMYAVAMGWIVLGPIGWVVLGGGFVVWLGATFFIEANKDNKLQEWLARCHFGSAPAAKKYPDAKTHIEQYGLAIAN